MKYWDQQYVGQIFHVDYDKLTIDQAVEKRKLIEHLELAQVGSCLSPQNSKRIVKTASQQ